MRKKRLCSIKFQVELHYDNAQPVHSLALYADALILLHGNPALDEALSLAHNINASAHQFDMQQRQMKADAANLQRRLAEIEMKLNTEGDS